MKIIFNSYANKTSFHMKSFALSLAFIMRFKVSYKVLLIDAVKLKGKIVSLLQ